MIRTLFALGAGERGGAERALLALVRHLPDHGVEPMVAAMASGPFVEELRRAGIAVIDLAPIPRLRNVWAVPGAIRELADAVHLASADVIIGSGEKMATLAVAAARKVGRPSVAWLHDAPGQTQAGRAIQAALRMLHPDTVIASSRWMTDEFSRRLRREVVCVPYGLELSDLADVVPAEDAISGWKGRTVFAFVGQLQRWKGVDVFVRAAAAVATGRDDVGFLVVGGSRLGREHEFEESLPRLAVELGLGDKMRFLGHRPDAVSVMAAADVVVHASREPEPLGIVIMEAMALGKPVIASRTRRPEELIDDGRTGVLTAPDDVDQLAAAIDKLASAVPAERARIGAAARDAFREEWSAQAMAERFASALTEIPTSLDIAMTAQNVVRGDGQGRFALELGRELARRGSRVTVYAHTCDPDLRAVAEFRRIRRVPGPQALDDVAFLAQATPRVRRGRHDVVVALGPTSIPSRPFVQAAQYSHRGWRNTWTQSGPPGARFRMTTSLAIVLEALTARRARRIVALSRAISEDLSPGHSIETTVVANGVDVDEFAPTTESERVSARHLLALPANALVIGFVGEYFTARKGLDPLLDAVAKGPSEEHLLIAGRGPDLLPRLAASGISDRVKTLGYVDPRALYRACDVVVVPSSYEPFSIVTAEALASGVPVVVSSSVGAAAFVNGGGIVIEPPTAEEIRRALDSLWAEPERRREMGQAARRAAQELRWDKVSRPAADAVESVGWENRGLPRERH